MTRSELWHHMEWSVSVLIMGNIGGILLSLDNGFTGHEIAQNNQSRIREMKKNHMGEIHKRCMMCSVLSKCTVVKYRHCARH